LELPPNFLYSYFTPFFGKIQALSEKNLVPEGQVLYFSMFYVKASPAFCAKYTKSIFCKKSSLFCIFKF